MCGSKWAYSFDLNVILFRSFSPFITQNLILKQYKIKMIVKLKKKKIFSVRGEWEIKMFSCAVHVDNY